MTRLLAGREPHSHPCGKPLRWSACRDYPC
jgi:hypothetical protein